MNRLDKELRKLELHLRKMAEEQTITIPDHMPFPEGTEIVLIEHQETEPWTCNFCERDFPSYPRLLNHKCHEENL